ncbi:DUF3301 domain-containing protein [Solemya velesiana gill symbiont]|uniref:DUF3301 domain-containing protein n=1 Tax=Solemya velesiana gill symbiont TaxID=1918948 RepID=A0A1T2KX40_9GAMM|nr:DUF3301 domain-containing protein [Solemya velesiana gill symbiont]OOZ37428.1 hypothetical protein BOW51_02465 [Solemya velesiana gill symbiont]
MPTISSILLIALIIWFWLDSARAREIATGICAAACAERNLQFLDQTVALRRLGLRWTQQGIRIRRRFAFDCSEEGEGRHVGHITLVGIQLKEFSLGLPSSEDSAISPRRPPDGPST